MNAEEIKKAREIIASAEEIFYMHFQKAAREGWPKALDAVEYYKSEFNFYFKKCSEQDKEIDRLNRVQAAYDELNADHTEIYFENKKLRAALANAVELIDQAEHMSSVLIKVRDTLK